MGHSAVMRVHGVLIPRSTLSPQLDNAMWDCEWHMAQCYAVTMDTFSAKEIMFMPTSFTSLVFLQLFQTCAFSNSKPEFSYALPYPNIFVRLPLAAKSISIMNYLCQVGHETLNLYWSSVWFPSASIVPFQWRLAQSVLCSFSACPSCFCLPAICFLVALLSFHVAHNSDFCAIEITLFSAIWLLGKELMNCTSLVMCPSWCQITVFTSYSFFYIIGNSCEHDLMLLVGWQEERLVCKIFALVIFIYMYCGASNLYVQLSYKLG